MSNFSNATPTPQSTSRNVGYIVGWAIIASITLIANLINIVIILGKKNLRNVTNIIMVSMFFADVLFSLVYLFPRNVNPTRGADNWLYCTLIGNIPPTIITSINLHLVAVSIDKLLATEMAVKYRLHAKPLYAVIVVIIIWVISIFIGFLPIIAYRPVIVGRCYSLHFADFNKERTYIIVHAALFFILPFFVMTGVYIRIFCFARALVNRSKVRDYKSAMADASDRKTRRQVRKHYKVAKVLSIIVLTYFIMWTPFYSTYLIFFTNASLLRWPGANDFLTFTTFFAFCYPAVNAILYGYFINEIRSAIFTCRSCKTTNMVSEQSGLATETQLPEK